MVLFGLVRKYCVIEAYVGGFCEVVFVCIYLKEKGFTYKSEALG